MAFVFNPFTGTLDQKLVIEGTPSEISGNVVLNDNYEHFHESYQLCHAGDILEYLDKKVKQKFDAKKDCAGCVFTNNVNQLDDFIMGKLNRFAEFGEPLEHENFI